MRWFLAIVAGVAALALLAGCGAETTASNPLIVVYSDSGAEGYELAALRGVAYSAFPAARVVDGAVGMAPFDLASAAYVIDLAAAAWPAGTIAVGAVNPGNLPGTECIVAVSEDGRLYVAPNNGLLSRIAQEPGLKAIYSITNQELFTAPLSESAATVVLPQAAALLADGHTPDELGAPLADIVRLDIPDAGRTGNALRGAVVFVDGFGNCLTNIPAALVAESGLVTGDRVRVSWPGGAATMMLGTAYADVPRGRPVAILDESQSLRLAINMSSFAATHDVGAGTALTVKAVEASARRRPPVLAAAQRAVQGALDKLDADLAEAATALAGVALDSPEARAVLQDLVARHPEVVDFATVDAAGTMRAVEPAAYQSSQGADISDQEQIRRLRATGKPVLSRTFDAVEGFAAVDLEHPILAADGTLAGSVSALLKTETFLGGLIEPLAMGPRVDKVWAMDRQGVILYDPDPSQVGTNLFTDPLYKPYKDLLALGRVIARKPIGEGSYEFLAKGMQEVIVKDATWVSVGLHGTEWRLIAALRAAEGS